MTVEATDRRAEVRELRRTIRDWRRGRAELNLVEALGDAYIALFATVMLTAMLGNVLIGVGRVAGDLCTSEGCREGRALLPWLVALGGVVVVLGLSRMFGPVFTSPATASWLLSTPADRGALLRRRLGWPMLLGFAVVLVVTAAGATLGGLGPAVVVAAAATAGLLAAGGVAFAALGQGRRLLPVGWALTLVLWAALLLLALHRLPELDAPRSAGPWIGAALAATALTVALAVLAHRRLPFLHARTVAPGGRLAPGLSGALAALDLALAYDVLLAHHWRRRTTVGVRRGGPRGLAAVVWTDLVRIRRRPVPLVGLAATVVVPYAVAVTGAERVVFLVTTLAGFLAALPLLGGLRVLTRSADLTRMLPFSLGAARWATLAVPGVALLAFGLAGAPAVAGALDVQPGDGFLVGVAVGAVSLAAAVRWVTGRPPDYGRPLVSSPAGAIPTNLYGSALRGVDMWLLTGAPMLLAPGGGGAVVSVVLAMVIVGYLAGRR